MRMCLVEWFSYADVEYVKFSILNPLDSEGNYSGRPLYRMIRSWYTGRWWVDCYIWYSKEGTGRAAAPPSPLLAVPNVTAHPSTVIVLLYDGALLCSFNVVKPNFTNRLCVLCCSCGRWFSIDCRRRVPYTTCIIIIVMWHSLYVMHCTPYVCPSSTWALVNQKREIVNNSNFVHKVRMTTVSHAPPEAQDHRVRRREIRDQLMASGHTVLEVGNIAATN